MSTFLTIELLSYKTPKNNTFHVGTTVSFNSLKIITVQILMWASHPTQLNPHFFLKTVFWQKHTHVAKRVTEMSPGSPTHTNFSLTMIDSTQLSIQLVWLLCIDLHNETRNCSPHRLDSSQVFECILRSIFLAPSASLAPQNKKLTFDHSTFFNVMDVNKNLLHQPPHWVLLAC